ncbi:hypothetical protein ZWY2020_051450 [Hordeum vulgare]|nr:hypothetical protein ZWY2020_051450 [Hordeum vulgare]
MASWSDLPVDLLPLVLANLPNPADRARSRAVCRAWRSAVSHIERPSLPWVAMWEGEVVTPSDGRSHRLPSFPDNAVCTGSTDDWLLVGLGRKRFFRGGGYAHVNHGYLLHNPFSDTSVPLTTLNSTITDHETCYIRRFLMRSTADDFIAVVTDRMDYSVIVFREGKGVWLPEPKTAPYMDIIDVAFLEDTLYAIDRGENLIPLHLALDDDGKPLVTKGKCVIRHPLGYYYYYDDDDDNGDDDNGHDDDDEDGGVCDDDNDDDNGENDNGSDEDNDDGGACDDDEDGDDGDDDDGISDDDDDDEYNEDDDDENNKDVDGEEEEDEESEGKEEEEEEYYDKKEQDYDELCRDNVEEKNEYDENEEYYDEEYEKKVLYGLNDGSNNYFNSAEECTRNEETNEEDIITRHLIESLGKLLLVRRLRRIPSSEMIRGYTRHGYTLQVEVLEADLTIGAWVPLVRLGGGRALFVSQDFSRFVPAPCGEIEEDVMYNLDTGEVFDLNSHTSTRCCCSPSSAVTWLFPPNLVL